jgi:hypothetical protein
MPAANAAEPPVGKETLRLSLTLADSVFWKLGGNKCLFI